jgi:spore coat polysaccharide biosynthesis protein SpsF (cytidylyltransferase family)
MKTIMQEINDAVIIICSTPYSKRIPEKCFKKVNGKSALEHILDRIQSLNYKTIMAMPLSMTMAHYDEYKKKCVKHKPIMFWGDDNSPLHRMAEAIKKWYRLEIPELKEELPKYIIRITHDDIIIDSETIIQMLDFVRLNQLTYCCTPSIIDGAGVEVILMETILKQAEKISYPVEHISYFVKGGNPGTFLPRESIQRPYRLCLDYPEDAIVLEAMLRQVGNDATVDKICEYLDNNQGLLRYNALPEITVYTCMRNAERWIRDCVSSVCVAEKLSKTSVEYIIIDDASSDDSLSRAISQLGLWGFTNTKILVNEHNLGLASSSNIALSMAKGKYIMRVDGDDMISNGAIREMVKKIKEDDAVIVYPDYEEMNGNIGEYIIKTYQRVKGCKYHHAGCALMNKRVINELKFKEGLRHWDSIELYKRIKSHSELKISYLDEILFTYRKHDNNLSKSEPEKRKKIIKEIFGNGQHHKAN